MAIYAGHELKTGKRLTFPEPIIHVFLTGISGQGKTEACKVLAHQFVDAGKTVLIVDSKDERDYANFGHEILPPFVEVSEPLEILSLVEAIAGFPMQFYFDTIIAETSASPSLDGVYKKISEKIKLAEKAGRDRKNVDWLHPKELGKIRVVGHLLGLLLNLLKTSNVQSRLELRNGEINVLDISVPQLAKKFFNLKTGFQQLILRSAIQQLPNNTVLFVDELHKFIPQRWSSVTKQPLGDLVSEGRSRGIIVVMSDQATTRCDKESLKNVHSWVMGKQREKNEVKDTLETVSEVFEDQTKVKPSDIKGLDVGTFIVTTDKWVKTVYWQPLDATEDEAILVAQGKEPPETIAELIKERRKMQTIKKQEPRRIEPIIFPATPPTQPSMPTEFVEELAETTARNSARIQLLVERLDAVESLLNNLPKPDTSLNDKITRLENELVRYSQGFRVLAGTEQSNMSTISQPALTFDSSHIQNKLDQLLEGVWKGKLKRGEIQILHALAQNPTVRMTMGQVLIHTSLKKGSAYVYLSRLQRARLIVSSKEGIQLSPELYK